MDSHTTGGNAMTATEGNRLVEARIAGDTKWRREFEALRKIALSCGLAESLKWGVPCYSLGEKNVVLVHGFKEYCALLFFKGALLRDHRALLVRQTENVQAGRQIRFTGLREIAGMKSILTSYIKEAIRAEQAGLKVPMKKTAEISVPEEFQSRLNANPGLKMAFAALTPGWQRGYLLYFSSAKLPKTRGARVEKYTKRILQGKGLEN